MDPIGNSMIALTVERWRASVRPAGPNWTSLNGSRWFWMLPVLSSSAPPPLVPCARDRIPRVELHVLVHPAADPDVQAVVHALAVADIDREARGAERAERRQQVE